jgi:hypothetical protein
LSVMAPEEVKKLYDMVVVMRYVVRNYNPAVQSPPVTRVYEGEFDVSLAAFYTVDQNNNGNGGEFYEGGTTSTGTAVGTSTPYNDFKTGNSNLFGTISSTYVQPTDDPVSYKPEFFYTISFRRLGSTDYVNFIRAYQTQHITNWATAQAAVGFTGKPIDYKSQNIIETLTETYPTGFDTDFQYPASTTAEDQRYYETITDAAVGEVVTLSRDNLLVGVTLPSTQTSIAADETILVEADLGSNLSVFVLEDWGGDGAFEYY